MNWKKNNSKKRRNQYEAQGDFNKAREYNQVYGIVIDLLEQLYELDSDSPMDFKGFYEVLEAGFEQLELKNVPARMDEIIIGDLTRSRINDKKLVFVLGVNEGLVPLINEGASLLTDKERDIMDGHGFALAPSASKALYKDRFYIYLKLLKATEDVYLSYALIDDEGKVGRPSHLIHMLQKLCPKVPVGIVDDNYRTSSSLSTSEMAYEDLMDSLKLDPNAGWELYLNWFRDSSDYKDQFQQALKGKKNIV